MDPDEVGGMIAIQDAVSYRFFATEERPDCGEGVVVEGVELVPIQYILVWDVLVPLVSLVTPRVEPQCAGVEVGQ